MPKRLTVVLSQGQSANPAKRKLEEEIVAALLMERGVDVTVIPHLYDLTPDGTGMLCLQGIGGDMVVLGWLFPRAAHWTLDRNGIRGRVGEVLLSSEAEDDDEPDDDDADKPRVTDHRPAPNRTIWCLDLRAAESPTPFVEEIRRIAAEATTQTVGLMNWINGTPRAEQLERYLHGPEAQNPLREQPRHAEPGRAESSHAAPGQAEPGLAGAAPRGNDAQTPLPTDTGALTADPPESARVTTIDEQPARRWYPVIDYSRCTNCMECIDFCLFGVYGVDGAETILVEQPDNCRKGCPACSRVCPENAIIFPQHKSPAIAGSAEVAASLKIDLSKLFGGNDGRDALSTAVLERDEQLLLAGRETVGAAVGVPRRQPDRCERPKDDLDAMIDAVDELDL